MTATQQTATGKVTGHILREKDEPWLIYDVLILCPDNTTIAKPCIVRSKSHLAPKGTQVELRHGKLGFEAI